MEGDASSKHTYTNYLHTMKYIHFVYKEPIDIHVMKRVILANKLGFNIKSPHQPVNKEGCLDRPRFSNTSFSVRILHCSATKYHYQHFISTHWHPFAICVVASFCRYKKINIEDISRWCSSSQNYTRLSHFIVFCCALIQDGFTNTVKPVCNDHLYNKIYYLWFIQ